MGTPPASRPHMPGYGISPADGGEGLLPWSWATDRLIASHDYWLSTVRTDGAPHVMPVWGIWLDDRFVFSTGGRTRKARNLVDEPRCVVTTERPDEPVIVEGAARRIDRPDELARVVAAYAAKYGSEPPDPAENPVIEVLPHVVFALCEEEGRFTTTPTRWELSPRPRP